MSTPLRLNDPEQAADLLIERLGGNIRLAIPVGLGKPALLMNALYRRARAHAEISLDVYTALTLEKPQPRSGLEGRFLGPLVERLYGAVPDLDYAADLRSGTLPPNVRVHEFYFRPGALLGSEQAQRRYISSNYTHAARDIAGRDINVIAQMIAPAGGPDASRRYSLSCNPDLTADLLDALAARGQPPPLLLGEVNPALPFLRGDAEMAAADFTLLVEGENVDYDLFPVPSRPVSLTEQVIGLRVAALVRDGGTLQIGIGSMGTALAAALAIRHRDNPRFRALMAALRVPAAGAELDHLPTGLYAMSEMFVEGFAYLREQGVLTRTVDDGVFLDGGFFLGSATFYQRLRDSSDAERAGIRMRRISFTNSLLGDEARKREQRRRACFVNTAMKATLLGAAVSDGLEDGRVVSGVGGQYNFVAMAHELEGARSVLVLPATRRSRGRVTSNIVWRYGHVTIPRHLRDVVVTEYGVADLRGKDDQDTIVAMLNIADSRFQERLRREAVKSGKLPPAYRIPERFRNNSPDALARALRGAGLLAALPYFPLGSDFTAVEAELAVALDALADRQGNWPALTGALLRGWSRRRDPRLHGALERLGLATPGNLREHGYRALAADALIRDVHEAPRPLF